MITEFTYHISKLVIKGLIEFYNSVLVSLVQQTTEVVGHVSILLYRDALFLTSVMALGMADFSMGVSRICQSKVKEVQERYGWL